MQRPTDNPEGYQRTRLLDRVKALKRPLLLAHGLSDDNVHFSHSAHLVESLQQAGKRFETAFYPNRDHGIDGGGARTDLFFRITRFIQENL